MLILPWVKRWLSQHLYGLGLLVSGDHDKAALFSLFLLLPGVILHELSHWLAAKALRVPTGRLTLGPRRREEALTFASLTVSRSDPLRKSVIGLAPLLGGTLAIFLTARWGWPFIPWGSAPDEALRHLISHLGEYARAPRLLLLLYLLFSLSNGMLPSEADRQGWLPVVLFGVLVILLSSVVGFLPHIPGEVTFWISRGLEYLTLALLITLAVDGLFFLLIYPLEWLVGAMRGQGVEYR